jgi:flagellar basal body-associated protein FliL
MNVQANSRSHLASTLERMARVQAMIEVSQLQDHDDIRAAHASAATNLKNLCRIVLGTDQHPVLLATLRESPSRVAVVVQATETAEDASVIVKALEDATNAVTELEQTAITLKTALDDVSAAKKQAVQDLAVTYKQVQELRDQLALLELGALPSLSATVEDANAALIAAMQLVDKDNAELTAQRIRDAVVAVKATLDSASAALRSEQALQYQASKLRNTVSEMQNEQRAAQFETEKGMQEAKRESQQECFEKLDDLQLQYTALLTNRERAAMPDCIALNKFLAAAEQALDTALNACIAEDPRIAQAALETAAFRLNMCNNVFVRVVESRDDCVERIHSLTTTIASFKTQCEELRSLANTAASTNDLLATVKEYIALDSRRVASDFKDGSIYAESSVGARMRLSPEEAVIARALLERMSGNSANTTMFAWLFADTMDHDEAAVLEEEANAFAGTADQVKLTSEEIATVVAGVCSSHENESTAWSTVQKSNAIATGLRRAKQSKFDVMRARLVNDETEAESPSKRGFGSLPRTISHVIGAAHRGRKEAQKVIHQHIHDLQNHDAELTLGLSRDINVLAEDFEEYLESQDWIVEDVAPLPVLPALERTASPARRGRVSSVQQLLLSLSPMGRESKSPSAMNRVMEESEADVSHAAFEQPLRPISELTRSVTDFATALSTGTSAISSISSTAELRMTALRHERVRRICFILGTKLIAEYEPKFKELETNMEDARRKHELFSADRMASFTQKSRDALRHAQRVIGGLKGAQLISSPSRGGAASPATSTDDTERAVSAVRDFITTLRELQTSLRAERSRAKEYHETVESAQAARVRAISSARHAASASHTARAQLSATRASDGHAVRLTDAPASAAKSLSFNHVPLAYQTRSVPSTRSSSPVGSSKAASIVGPVEHADTANASPVGTPHPEESTLSALLRKLKDGKQQLEAMLAAPGGNSASTVQVRNFVETIPAVRVADERAVQSSRTNTQGRYEELTFEEPHEAAEEKPHSHARSTESSKPAVRPLRNRSISPRAQENNTTSFTSFSRPVRWRTQRAHELQQTGPAALQIAALTHAPAPTPAQAEEGGPESPIQGTRRLDRLASPRTLGRIDVTSGDSLHGQSMRWRWNLRD